MMKNDLLSRAKAVDNLLDYITDELAHLQNEHLETSLAQPFETVSRFIWDIIEYLETGEVDNEKQKNKL